MTILLDAMGGDNAPEEAIKGAVLASKELQSNIILIGDENKINPIVKELYQKDSITEVSSKLSIRHTSDIITMDDNPTQSIKSKKDSSMVVGFDMVKNDLGDVFVSAGNSGALLTGATLLVGRIKGVDRPALSSFLPAYKSKVMMLDVGANTNCKVINMVQFAQMANIYLKSMYNMESPRIGLLNNGTEETKGTDLLKETYAELKEKAESLDLNFIGNIEGREIMSGNVDVVVADGFTGNIALKSLEGMGKFVKRTLTESIKKNIFSMIGSLPALPVISKWGKTMDYKEYGGALFLGVKKPIIKAHGSSDAKIFYYTLRQAEDIIKTKVVEKLINQFTIFA
jgi:glycerol-3-phosphate acyltransferase PlsX